MSHSVYDALLIVSFGGPEGPDDVMPFLENVLRGKPIPRQRMLEVAEHYYHFGGVSPINSQNRSLIDRLRAAFLDANINLPIYWGNRNWQPTLAESLEAMKNAGVKRALAFFTSMFSSYSGCRQYRENLIEAAQQVGEGAPQVDKLRFGFNHPLFISTMANRVMQAVQPLAESSRGAVPVLFTAHSIPLSMSAGCSYERQLRESCRLVAQEASIKHWELVYQSRSGSPQHPWLEPDVNDRIVQLHEQQSLSAVVIAPIGFISDHMEVMYDLDHEVADRCRDLGIAMSRAGTAGIHDDFIAMIVDLVRERIDTSQPRRALGDLGPWHDVCPLDCCLK